MPADVTRLLQSWTAGDPAALDRLLPAVYDELRQPVTYVRVALARAEGRSLERR